jgi:hypothetical protein
MSAAAFGILLGRATRQRIAAQFQAARANASQPIAARRKVRKRAARVMHGRCGQARLSRSVLPADQLSEAGKKLQREQPSILSPAGTSVLLGGGLLLALLLLRQNPSVGKVEKLGQRQEIVRAVAVGILPLVANLVAAAVGHAVPRAFLTFVFPD